MPFDQGAGDHGDKSKLRGAFKVPSLRNIARTAPYMHSGRFATLEEATEFYTKGRGHAVAEQKLLLHWHIWEPKLSAEENQQIAAFLQTLTDQSLTPQLPQQLPLLHGQILAHRLGAQFFVIWDPELDAKLNFTFNKAQYRTVNVAMSNTFGFGGHNTSAIFRKLE
mgnify:CR=1 FL=1